MSVNTTEDELPKIRGDVLKKAREAKGLEPDELASAVCLDKRHIFQVETIHYYKCNGENQTTNHSHCT